MSNLRDSLASRVREINSSATPAGGDVGAVIADHRVMTPRERYVLFVIAAVPNATLLELAVHTHMDNAATQEALRCLLNDGSVYATRTGGFITASAAVIA